MKGITLGLLSFLCLSIMAGDFSPEAIARAELYGQNYDKALGLFENILSEHPESLEAVLGRMDSRIYLKQRDEAIKQAQSHFEEKTPESICVQAHTLIWKRERDQAKTMLTEALKTHPDHYYLNYQLAYLYWAAKDYDKSVSYAAKAVEVEPDFSEGYYLLGDAYRGKGHIEGVIKAWNSYLERIPKLGKRFELVSSYLKGLSGR